MVCERCIRALQEAIKRYLAQTDQNEQFPPKQRPGMVESYERIPPPRSDVLYASNTKLVRLYRDDRLDLLLRPDKACWICAKLALRLRKQNAVPRRVNCTESYLLEYECLALITSPPTFDYVVASLDIRPSRIETEESGENDGCEIEVQYIINSGNPCYHLPNPGNLDDDIFDTILAWLDSCQSTHKTCQHSHSSLVPTRLLYLGETGDDIKLVITSIQSTSGPYLTLSHRWGSEVYTKLIGSTINKLQQGINVEKLPLTFQDAIKITRRLGFKYLWIDSLCIIQDNELDWLHESSKMADVYSNAVLNLSATGSTDSSFSLFHDRDLKPYIPSLVDFEIGAGRREYYLLDGNVWNDEIAHGPLNHRAWVFQERMLARRVLHFGSQQIAWECCEFEAMELFPEGLPHKNYNSLSKSKFFSILTATSQQNCLEKSQKMSPLWRNMMETYSACCLTESKDKLVALSGLAKRVNLSTKDDYIAGMWRSTLVYDLPWWREWKVRVSSPRTSLPYRAPSWAWASVDGEINFPETIGRDMKTFVQVLEIDLTYTNKQDPTGPLSGGSIKIKCSLSKIHLEDLLEDESFSGLRINGHHFDITRDESVSFLYPEMNYQDLRDWNTRGELYGVLCYTVDEKLIGILLTISEKGQAYHRVGSFVVEAPGDNSGCVVEEIIMEGKKKVDERMETEGLVKIQEERETTEEQEEEKRGGEAANMDIAPYESETSMSNEKEGSVDSDLAGRNFPESIKAAKEILISSENSARATFKEMANTLKSGSQDEDPLPCDFYDDNSGLHTILIL